MRRRLKRREASWNRPYVQPTKPTKAVVAALVTLLGLVGVHVTHGTAELVLTIVQLLVVTYAVWRTRNAPVSK